MSGKIDVEKIIKEIRHYPALYDLNNENYRNSEYKERIWKQISKDLKVEGGSPTCKAKWTNIRDQFRKTLKKRKIATTHTRKYKYEDCLQFLVPHFTERDTHSNIILSQEGNDVEEEDDEYFDKEIKEEGTYQQEESGIETEDEQGASDIPNDVQENSQPKSSQTKKDAFVTPLQVKSKSFETNNTSRDSASSQLMSFILEEKKSEERMTKELRPPHAEQLHPVDAFLAGISPTLKTLNPVFLNQAKSRIFSVVQELEMKQLMSDQGPPLMMNYPRMLDVRLQQTSPDSSSINYISSSPSYSSSPPSCPESHTSALAQPMST